ncbi:MAG: M24 family metallopeptidase [Phycisphaerae bacterium]|nr:M24 family metallopeptidase [Phycisphaerae bacterium]
MSIPLRTCAEIEAVARAGRVLDGVLALGVSACSVGTTTLDIARVMEGAISRAGAEPILASVRGASGPYGQVCCISVNEELVHSLPRRRIIREGDVVSIDCAVRFPSGPEGWCVDAARAVAVGSPLSQRGTALCAAANAVITQTMRAAYVGGRWSSCAAAGRHAAAAMGCCLLAEYTGHGIGRILHEPPTVSYDPRSHFDFELRPGTVFTIEPIVVEGFMPPECITLEDGWTVISSDRRWSAHAEVTVSVETSGLKVVAGEVHLE